MCFRFKFRLPGNNRKALFRRKQNWKHFSDLAVQYTPLIKSIIRSLSIYKNKEEFFQVGLLALWEAETKYDPQKGTFQTFAYSIIKGRMLNELKKSNKWETRNQLTYEQGGVVGEALPFHANFLELEQLDCYCEGLTVNQKQWLILTYFHRMSITEIAMHTNTTPSAVKSWRRSALKKLKDSVDR
ncbi:RNA polymerase subunit sigma-24 [Bacillus sp. M6-12]|uniref:sigma-70 family RNA polymerase sigma factor n=1 Tax=Bacillus sp. M6-12 TaxID=2054166 RepID=UPI000C7685A0|nr:sigma-70 family RNA polymerase sigma factor [Bacillus sp. M6-12]PLS16462.1 RNA polymerase subunit sigma-24 [Bacillus sp. M6-12]